MHASWHNEVNMMLPLQLQQRTTLSGTFYCSVVLPLTGFSLLPLPFLLLLPKKIAAWAKGLARWHGVDFLLRPECVFPGPCAGHFHKHMMRQR